MLPKAANMFTHTHISLHMNQLIETKKMIARNPVSHINRKKKGSNFVYSKLLFLMLVVSFAHNRFLLTSIYMYSLKIMVMAYFKSRIESLPLELHQLPQHHYIEHLVLNVECLRSGEGG